MSTVINRQARWLALASAFALTAIVYLVYASAVSTGFFADDYNLLPPAVRLDPLAYFTYYFDPRLPTHWYRPLQGAQFWIEWQLFGADPAGFHLVNILIHAINAALLFALVWRAARRWRIAFLAALTYATFPVYALTVNWICATDSLMTIFYLLGTWFWLNYLERESKRDYLIVLVAFALSLLAKQMAITLPAILFLIDRWLIAQPSTWVTLIRRYAMLVVVAGIFAAIQYSTRSTHTFAEVFGYSLGAQILSMLIQYLSLLVFPWGYYPPTDTQITEGFPFADTGNLIWLASAIVLFVFLAVSRKSRVLGFLGSALLITLVPVLPFPFVELRYLYLPAMTSGILLALWFDHALTILQNARWAKVVTALALGLIVLGSALSIASANAGIVEIARQRRVPFRDIERQHPTFPAGTYLYFIDPVTPLSELTGMFLARYGRTVNVGGDRDATSARLRDASNVLVYYFDDTGKPVEVQADVKTALETSPLLPIVFDQPIVLDDAEIVQSHIRRGDVLIALLYWHSTGNIDRDYTVFVHLVDAHGNLVAGYDDQPRKGTAPTSRWTRNVPLVDPIVMPIPSDIPSGDYHLEVGLYYFPTMQRLAIVNASGQPISDTVVIEPLTIVD